MTRENLAECKPVNLAHLGIKERADLQHVLRDHIEVLDSDLRVIAEEYGNWEDSRRRIDPARPRQAAAPGLEDPTTIEETLRGQGSTHRNDISSTPRSPRTARRSRCPRCGARHGASPLDPTRRLRGGRS